MKSIAIFAAAAALWWSQSCAAFSSTTSSSSVRRLPMAWIQSRLARTMCYKDSTYKCHLHSTGSFVHFSFLGTNQRQWHGAVDERLGLSMSSDSQDEANESTKLSGVLAAIRSIDIPLLAYFAAWYLGNYFYKITNKRALQAAGGAAGFPMTISSLQLGIGSLYGIFLWIAPEARPAPRINLMDLLRMIPLAFCYAGAHNSSSFAYSAGSVSFAEIVKAAEPAFAAVLSQYIYNRPVSRAKRLCLPIIIGGVILATAKELNFSIMALISACIANMFAAFRANENKRIMTTTKGGLKDRIGGVGNQFALTSILSFALSLPFLVLLEGHRWGEFVNLVQTSNTVRNNLIASALWFYGYNEVSTMTLKKTGAVTQSVANTAKRIIVLVGAALVFGEAWTPLKALGSAIGIGGVFLYSIADQVFTKSTS